MGGLKTTRWFVSFAVALGFDAVAASRALFSAFYSSLPAGKTASLCALAKPGIC